MEAPSIYLSGPIAGLTFYEATEWRHQVTDALEDYAELLDPMRDVEADSGETILTATVTDALDVRSIDPAMMTDRGLVTRDHHDTCRSTLLIVNLLGAHKASIGTIVEIAWAWDRRIPTIVVMEDQGNPHEHPFVRELSSYRVDTIARAIEVAKSVIGVTW